MLVVYFITFLVLFCLIINKFNKQTNLLETYSKNKITNLKKNKDSEDYNSLSSNNLSYQDLSNQDLSKQDLSKKNSNSKIYKQKLPLSVKNQSNNNFRLLANFFNKKDLIKFNRKYGNKSTILKSKFGQVTLTPSKYIEELPQISWNGYFVNNLVVYPKYRNRGYGSKLLEDAIDFGYSKGALHLISQVDVSNEAAISIHKSVGFGSLQYGFTSKGKEIEILIYNL